MAALFQGLMLICMGVIAIQTSNAQEKGNPVTERDVAVIETTMGTIEIELYGQETPRTVKNFIGLAEQGSYDGLIFHRVMDGFMIQGGDPEGTGRGGKSIYGKPFEDEFVDSLRHAEAGVVSMANRGPNTNTSQFFITLAPTPWLDGKHTIFGHVVGGMEVVRAIGKVKTTKPGDRPIEDVVMKHVTIRRAPKGE